MIFQPIKGQRVSIHYRKSAMRKMPCEGMKGVVETVSKGPGPRNVLVKFELWPDSGDHFFEVIARGNLVAI